MLVAVMHLAQVELAREIVGSEPIILIDDLPSELDNINRSLLLNYLKQMGNQTFITGVENISVGELDFPGVFHVEQGSISTG